MALLDGGFCNLLSGLVIHPALRHACRGVVVALRALHHRCAMRFMAIAAVCFAVMVAMRVECFVRSSLHQVLARGYLGAARIDMAAAFQAEGGLVA